MPVAYYRSWSLRCKQRKRGKGVCQDRGDYCCGFSSLPLLPYLWSVVLHGASFSLAQEKAHELSGGSPSGTVGDPCEAAEYIRSTYSRHYSSGAGRCRSRIDSPAVCTWSGSWVLVGRRDCRRPQLRVLGAKDDRVSTTNRSRSTTNYGGERDGAIRKLKHPIGGRATPDFLLRSLPDSPAGKERHLTGEPSAGKTVLTGASAPS